LISSGVAAAFFRCKNPLDRRFEWASDMDCQKTRISLSLPGIELLFLRFIRKCKLLWEDNIKKDLQEVGFGGMD